MAAFQLQPYDNTGSIGTILQLMTNGAHIRAQAIRDAAQAQAHATEVQGESSAQLGANLAQIASGVGNTIAQQFSPEAKMKQLQLTEAQRQSTQRNVFLNVIKNTPQVNEDGVSLYDIPTVAKQLQAQGVDPGEAVTHLNAINDAFRAERAAKLAIVQKGAAGIIAGGNDPVLADHFLEQLEKNGTYPADQIDQYRQFIKADPGNVAKVTAMLAGPQKMESAAPGSMARNPLSGMVVPGSQVPDKPEVVVAHPGDSVLSKDNPAAGPLYTAPAKDPVTKFESKSVTLDGKPRQMVNFDSAQGQYFLPGSTDPIEPKRIADNTPASIIINNDRQRPTTMPDFALTDARPTGPEANQPDPTIHMTPNGLHQAALNYIANGQYPPTGRGNDPISVAQREAINSKVGAISAASGMDVPTLRAFYKSNASSLTQQQKSADAVQAFMSTADKNADLLKQTMAKVPDTGIPIFNKPLRDFAKNVSGDPNLSQMATYLQSVQSEYAKILTQPNLNGQLTDSARHEAQTLLDPKATVQQILGSIEALRNEGTNRVVSIGEQIQRIQQRMQGGPGQQGKTPAAAPAQSGVISYQDYLKAKKGGG